ncbi:MULTISPECIES: response regulator transcription factor [unclassified Butyrivibrio]|jgi:YesN/AraC family two-component response regulator|uniref:response regulator transcription factor n=1 Tax=unclassified Butyrivibrio TaxID=2639466 RepID=UPI0003FB129B|nr:MULTISPECIES: response regulator [unclassified Butyrivibrio]MCR5341984.1 response regulator [Butyrivibrio sp.]
MQVLLVDDDRFVIAALQKGIAWESLGITGVFTANNINTAKEIMQDNKIDLLLSDIDMPHGSGLDLLSYLREQENPVPTIFLTNYADFSYAQKAIELKSFHYFLKPIDYAELTRIIKKALSEAQRIQEAEAAKTSSIPEIPTDSAENESNIKALLKYVDEHFREDISREQLSVMFFFDPDYITKIFKKETGMSYKNYVIEKRLSLAKELLTESDYPIHDISQYVGYDNYSYFTRLFKKSFGVTPIEFRGNGQE